VAATDISSALPLDSSRERSMLSVYRLVKSC